MAIDLLEELSPAQAAAVTSAAAPLAIVAGPGSGKTRTLTRRVAYRCRRGTADPLHTLVLTFSRRAASDVLGRLARLGVPTGGRIGGVAAGTFHATAWAELSRHRGAPVPVLGRPARLIGPAVTAARGRDPRPGEVASIADAWGRLRTAGTTPDDEVWAEYVRRKRRLGVVDLDDVLEQYTALLTEDPRVAEQARWRYRHVFVDEYQDLNDAHCRLLHAWVDGRQDVCVVGDPGQSIYGFNGSVPDIFERADEDWPGVVTLTLDDNFRSTPEIVRLAGALGDSRASRRPPGPVPTIAGYRDDEDEAAAIAAAIAGRRVPGRSWSGMAVLARTNARLRVIAAALDAAGVPWRIRDRKPLAALAVVQEALATLPQDASAAELDDVAPDVMTAALAEFRAEAPGGSVRAFGSWLDAMGVRADEGAADGVELATFHGAKGLEWPTVWVAGTDEVSDSAEERRLLYVALTRAEDELAVSWAAQPPQCNAALAAVWEDLVAQPTPDEQRRRLQKLRSLLAAS